MAKLTEAQLVFLCMILRNESFPQWFRGKSKTAVALMRKGLLVSEELRGFNSYCFRLTDEGRKMATKPKG